MTDPSGAVGIELVARCLARTHDRVRCQGEDIRARVRAGPAAPHSRSRDAFARRVVAEIALESVADRLRLLGHPTRLRLLGELDAEGELAVGTLVERAGLSYGAVSRQLALLHAHGLLSRRREGNRTYYRVTDPSFVRLCTAVSNRIREDWAGRGTAPDAETGPGLREPKRRL